MLWHLRQESTMSGPFRKASSLSYKEAFNAALVAETATKDSKHPLASYIVKKYPNKAKVHQLSNDTSRGESRAKTCHKFGGKYHPQQPKFKD